MRTVDRVVRSTPPAVLLVLAGAALASHSPLFDVDFDEVMGAGESRQIVVERLAWLRVESSYSHVYRMEVEGPNGAALELWRTYLDSPDHTHWVLSGQIAAAEVGEEPARLEWTAYGNTALRLEPFHIGVPATFTVAVEELAAPPDEHLLIPVVAHSPGAMGTFFRTDLHLFNLLDQDIVATLVLVPGGGDGSHSQSVSIAANHILAIDDVVLSLFGLEESKGPLQIYTSHYLYDLIAISRTYNSAESGTYGQFIGASHWEEAAGVFTEEPSRRLLYLHGSESFRSNLGMVEVMGVDAVVDVELVGSTGEVLGGGTVAVPASSLLQINDVFEYFSAPARDAAVATVEVTNQARVFSYASVLDNRSSDPIFVPGMLSDHPWGTLVVPAAASTDGAYGTRWRTDLRVASIGYGGNVLVTFMPNGGSIPVSRRFDFGDTGVLAIDDVVAEVGATGCGALFIEGTRGFRASTRTYNATAAGTYGQYVNARDLDYLPRWSSTPGIVRSEDYRTNIGMVNGNWEYPVDVAIHLVSGSGVLLGSTLVHLEVFQHLQLNDVFEVFHAPWTENCRVDFDVVASDDYQTGRVAAYASVIDNRSGDPVYLPAVETRRVCQRTLELDHRVNALLLDELPEAVGVSSLPGGVFAATVSGGGHVGGPRLPIHVLCLYKSPEGQLRSAAMAVGDRIEGVGGGQPFWCVIPDWGGTATNAGAVTVTLDSFEEEIRLDLDARENAVLLDRLLESVVEVTPPAEAYRAESTGDFGAHHLPPQPVVMYKEQDGGMLRVRTLEDREVVDLIDTDSRLLVVMLDWLNRDDNTGSTKFLQDCTTRTVSCGDFVNGSVDSTDCTVHAVSSRIRAERVIFEGLASHVVTITGDWEYPWGEMTLVDPTGNQIDRCSSSDEQLGCRLSGLTLPVSGEYWIWVELASWQGSPLYRIELECEAP